MKKSRPPISGFFSRTACSNPLKNIHADAGLEFQVNLFAYTVTFSIGCPDKRLPAAEIVASAVSVESMAPSDSTVGGPETYTQYEQAHHVYDWEMLYKKVWEKPVTEVAKQYKGTSEQKA